MCVVKSIKEDNMYPIIYVLSNFRIYNQQSLSPVLKQQILSASSSALKLCGKHDWSISFERAYTIHKRATPMKMMRYKLAIELHRLYNAEVMDEDWTGINQLTILEY